MPRYYDRTPKGWEILLGIVVGVIIFVSFIFVLPAIMCSKNDGDESPSQVPILSVESNKNTSTSCVYSKDGKRCVVINRFACPKGWGPMGGSECDENLEECSEDLEGIKKWCDPSCQEDLDNFLIEVQRAREDCYMFSGGIYF